MGTWRLISSHGQDKIPYCAKGSRNVLSLNMKGQFILKLISVGGETTPFSALRVNPSRVALAVCVGEMPPRSGMASLLSDRSSCFVLLSFFPSPETFGSLASVIASGSEAHLVTKCIM
jgi:hypothetical protein